ncbi:DUF1043 family protein [Halomonas sp. NO4]|uniref:YhcB family protein n=1 Tax=Halomonas sp. NO4 TaxID=2484813 RepID=UPI0013D3BCE6|nr:DUF1043 family protein [Halomonas sp. NO4]
MEYGNINWILAIACLLAGSGLGALGYHLAGSGAGHRQQLRQRLAERERELGQLRDRLDDHFTEIGTLIGRLQHESRALEQRLAEDAATFDVKGPSERPGLAVETEEAPLPTPRDYADGRGGTLSEDFGLKPSNDGTAQPQPPRY